MISREERINWLQKLWQCYIRMPQGWKRELSCDTLNELNKPIIRKWISTEEEFVDFCQKHEGRAIFVDIYAFNKLSEDEPAEDALAFGDLVFDVEFERPSPRDDGKVEKMPDLNLAWEATKRIVAILLEIGVPLYNIWLSASGRRGFHVRVPITTFLYGVELEAYLRRDLCEIYRALAEKVKERLPNEFRDAVCSSPYSFRRAFRLENTKHPLSGLYCVPLPIDCLSLSIDEILALMKQPQPVEWAVERLKASKPASEFLRRIIEELDRKPVEQRERREFPTLEEEWTKRPCVQACLRAIQEVGELFWLGRTQLAALAILAGWNDREIAELFKPCRDFNETATLDHIRRIRQKVEHPRKEGEVLLIPCERMRNEVWFEVQKDYRLAGKLPPEVFCDPNECPLMVMEIKLSEISAKAFGRRCKANVLISGVGASYRVPIYVEITCQGRDETLCFQCPFVKEPLKGGLWAREQLLLVNITEAVQKIRGALLLIERKVQEKNEKDPYLLCLKECLRNKKLRALVNVKAYWGTITQCYGLDTIDELKIDEKTAVSRKVEFYVCREPPTPGSKVSCIGTVGSIYETGRLVFVATEVRSVQEGIDAFDIEKERHILEKIKCQNPIEFAEKIERAIGLVQRVDECLSILLTYHSPLYIKYENETIPGWLTNELYGPTRTAKSELVKRIRKMCEQGVYLSLETASRTGLLYSIHETKAGPVILWGELVFADRGLVIVDGSNKMLEEEWIEFRESRVDGLLKVRRNVQGDAWMRTRLILVRNPERGESFDGYLYKVQAIKQAYQPPDIARIDILMPVDITPYREIRKKTIVEDEERMELCRLLKASVLWAWSRRPEDIIFTPEAKERIKENAEALYDRYEDREIPIVSSDIERKLIKICAAWSTLKHNVDEKHEKVIVTKEDVDAAVKWYDRMLKKNELDKQVILTRRTAVLSDGEREMILEDIGPTGREILTILAQEGNVQRDTLASYLEMEKATLDKHVSKLKRHGLIFSGRHGYNLRPKGKKLVKDILAADDQSLNVKNECDEKEGGWEGVCVKCGDKTRNVLIRNGELIWIHSKCMEDYEGEL